MKKFNKNSIVAAVIVLVVSFVLVALGLAGPIATHAFVSPAAVTLGTAGNFIILAETGITNTGAHGTHITGNIGNSSGAASQMNGVWCSEITGTIYGVDATYTGSGATACFAGNPGVPPVVPADANKTLVDNAVNDMVTVAYTDAAGRTPPDETGRAAGSIGGQTFTTGVYKWNSDVNIATNITLSGSATDVWIFQITGDLAVASKGSIALGVKVLLTGGAKPSNVFWQVGGPIGATLGTYSTFNGTILSAKQVILQTGAVLNGRALAQSLVTLDANTVSLSSTQLTVTKIIVNDNNGTKVIADFPLFIDGISVTSGVASTTSAGSHTVSETSDSGYTHYIGGDCAPDGTITLLAGDVKSCTITNDDITPPPPSGGNGGFSYVTPPVPPIIDVVKVPSPLALPAGPGPVTYTYTLRNIGTVPVTDITMVGDTCSPITLTSGDTNADSKLDVSETWIYNCSTTLSATHTNTVVATGWANGVSATDIANATVVVGVPLVPPLIHVTKVPNPLTLPAGGGMVTYTKKITNPGTVALSNVLLADDKCNPVTYISGDTNGDSKLDTTETWTYTCRANLTRTTTNTATASGDANGLTARDFAIVTVIVPTAVVAAAVPGLPNTGLPPEGENISWNIVILTGILIVVSTSLAVVSRLRRGFHRR